MEKTCSGKIGFKMHYIERLHKMKKLYFSLIIAGILLLLPFYIFPATCPTKNCPADRDTPLAEYLFQNNLNDSSGNNLTAGDGNPAFPVNYYQNIGGMPGYSVDNFSGASSISIPACVLYRSEGEIDWYQYVTFSGTSTSNYFLVWATESTNPLCYLFIVTGDGAVTSPDIIRVDYTTLDSTNNVVTEEFMGDWLVLNQWQHFNFQWGSFGTRFLIDGVMAAGDFSIWDQGAQDSPDLYLGIFPTTNDGFYGYLDDVEFWPCSSHGTMTQTPTLTATPTCTPGGPSLTITETFTQTTIFTETPTFTYTLSIIGTITATVTYTASSTFTITPTITPTFTITPTLIYSGFDLIGVYPSPAKKTTNFIFVSYEDCNVKISLYTVSGEKINEISSHGQYGVNNITYDLTNYSGRQLASGIYIYSIEMKSVSGSKKTIWKKLAVVK